MASLNSYIESRGITQQQMNEARERTQAVIDAYNLKQARKAVNMTQVQIANAMGVSQNRVSRMENGDLGAMSLSSLRRYVEALGGKLTMVADLPTGSVNLV